MKSFDCIEYGDAPKHVRVCVCVLVGVDNPDLDWPYHSLRVTREANCL